MEVSGEAAPLRKKIIRSDVQETAQAPAVRDKGILHRPGGARG